ncbi:MAG: hypothetical protein R3F59_22480 [Myxococcota bacterium]
MTHPEAASAAMERLVEATAHVDSWLGYPQEVQRALVGLASSIARHLQDEAEALLDANAREAIRAWFPVTTQWSKLYRPGRSRACRGGSVPTTTAGEPTPSTGGGC